MLPIASLYSAGVRVSPESDFADAANDGQRRPQLVRRIGGEAAELIERRFEARERVVDDRGQPADLVVRIRHRQPLVQAIGGDAPGLGREMIDRRQRPPREHVPANAGQRDDERKAEHQHDQDFPQLCPQPLLRPRHSQHDRRVRRPASVPVSVRQRRPFATIDS